MHCQVINNLPTSPQSLPATWANVSNFNALPQSELAKHGWFPFVASAKPNINPATHKLTQELYFDGLQVDEIWTVSPLTADEQKAYLQSIRPLYDGYVEQHMTEQVSWRDYKTIDSAIGRYLGCIKPAWAAESKQAQDFMVACWDVAYQIQDDVVSGKRAIPTHEQFIAELPKLGWQPQLPPGGGTGNGTFS